MRKVIARLRDIRLSITNKTLEWCAHCGDEVEILQNKVSNCPTCDASIRPCGDCPRDLPSECDWREDGYCFVFPNFRYTENNKEGKNNVSKQSK